MKRKVIKIDRNTVSTILRGRMSAVELAVQMAPVEQLISAIEKDQIYEDSEGKAVYSKLDQFIDLNRKNRKNWLGLAQTCIQSWSYIFNYLR